MKILNNTHYFSINNKLYNSVPHQSDWSYQNDRRKSYEQRLYWEYQYCLNTRGSAFFYTFTYNNASLPHYKYIVESGKEVSFPCFNYDHVRLITNGLISKTLRRKYGSQLRYFCACERGEGKGYRGKGKNPHYHFIFFVTPLPDSVRKDSDPPYKRISPIQFCHLCKCVWQYQYVVNSYDHPIADYKSARFGHVEPGFDCGLVSDFDALSYVSKYVCKDSVQMSDDFFVRSSLERKFKSLGFTWHCIYSHYTYLRTFGRIFDREDYLQYSGLDKYLLWRACFPDRRHDIDFFRYLNMEFPYQYDSYLSDLKDFFQRIYLPQVVDQEYRSYYNKYGSKVRCSKSLGIYGLSFVRDIETNPHFVLEKSSDVVSQRIALYYYRKIYMDLVRCPVTGNPLYVLNDIGVSLKCRQLYSSLKSCYDDLNSSLSFFSHNITNHSFLALLDLLDFKSSDYYNLINFHQFNNVKALYPLYHCVYQYRSYYVHDDSTVLDSSIALTTEPTIDQVLYDYRKFLRSNYYTVDYHYVSLMEFISFEHMSSPGSFVSFDSHPLFSGLVQYFQIADNLIECVRKFQGDIKKREFAESSALHQSVSSLRYSHVNVL